MIGGGELLDRKRAAWLIILEKFLESGELRRGRVHIRTKEKCPRCKRNFQETPVGLICPKCFTIPRRYFIDLSWQGRRIRLYSDKQGNPLSSFEQAKQLQQVIAFEIENRTFDPSRYVLRDQKEFLLPTYIERFIEHSERKGLKPSALKDRKRILRTHVLGFFMSLGINDIRDIRKKHIEEFVDHLRKRGKAPKTIYNIVAELKALLNYAHRREDLEKVPQFPEIKLPERIPAGLDLEVQLKILKRIPVEHRPIFQFMMTYGCRPSEARALMWDCVNFSSKEIFIKRTFSHRKLVELPKEGKWKVLPMHSGIEEILRELARRKRSLFVFSHSRADHYGEALLSKLWRKACAEIGLEGVSLYEGVRHSFAYQLLKQGLSYEEIGAYMGHSDVRTTRKYARLNPKLITLAEVEDRSRKLVSLGDWLEKREKKASSNRE